MRNIIFLALSFSVLVGCGSAKTDLPTNSASSSQVKPKDNSANSENLPDRIWCSRAPYKLVLILKDPQLAVGVTAIGLKNGESVVFKAATQIYTYTDQPHLLNFMEVPATSTSKQVVLDLQTKIAKVSSFNIPDLEDGSKFTCEF